MQGGIMNGFVGMTNSCGGPATPTGRASLSFKESKAPPNCQYGLLRCSSTFANRPTLGSSKEQLPLLLASSLAIRGVAAQGFTVSVFVTDVLAASLLVAVNRAST